MPRDAVTLGMLARGLAANRVVFGAGFLLAPELTRFWIGSAARAPGGRVMVRAMGARDLALAIGAIAALRSGADARPWFAAQAVSDAADFAATWLERDALSKLSTAFALTLAGASAAIGAAYVARGERGAGGSAGV